MSVDLDLWNPYDPHPADSAEMQARRREKLERDRQTIRQILPHLEREIESHRRDLSSVGEMLQDYHLSTRGPPMAPADLPELERLCRLVLARGGMRQSDIQRMLLQLIGATAAVEAIPFLIEMLHDTRRGDSFGPERRQLALWGLARIALFHDAPQAYETMREGLADRHADVRYATAYMIVHAYLGAGRDVPQDVVDRLRHMASCDGDDSVRFAARRSLRGL